jgi:hypothetical protein
MRGRKSPHVVALSQEELAELNRWLRTPSLPAGLVRRSRAILLVYDGNSLTEAGHIVGMGRRIVRLWVTRFMEHRIDGLKDKPGRGRKPSFPP